MVIPRDSDKVVVWAGYRLLTRPNYYHGLNAMQEILDAYRTQINEIEILYRRGALTLEERYHLIVLRTVDLHKTLFEFWENH